MGLFRRSQTPPDAGERHALTLELIEQLALLTGRVSSMEVQWDEVRTIVRKGYQRMEKACERFDAKLEKAGLDDQDAERDPPVAAGPELVGFAKKLAMLKKGA